MTTPCPKVNSVTRDARIVILAFPFATPAMVTPVSKMARIFSSLCTKTVLLGNNYFSSSHALPSSVRIIVLKHTLEYAKDDWRKVSSLFRWLVMNLSAQLEMGRHLWILRDEIDFVLSTAGCYYQIPCLLAKVLRKRLFCSSFGTDPDIALANHGRVAAFILYILSSIDYMLADKIIVDSSQTMQGSIFRPFREKLFIGNRYVEDDFRIRVPYADRERTVGYIGRISKEKGILDFVKALPDFLDRNPDISVIIIGSGGLDKQFKAELQQVQCSDRIKWIRWVDHVEIPEHLNRLRLLVVPSCTEGTPNVILEAMACGTPVLATRVGGIPSLIVDGVSGFLLKNDSPHDFSRAITGALNHPEIQKIIFAGRRIIDEEYSFSTCENRYKKLFN
jgi:glycosyltransferase involved in cell wall biosynthesis